MINFLIGFLVGAILVDVLWAWRTGRLQWLYYQIKINRIKKRNARRETVIDWMDDVDK